MRAMTMTTMTTPVKKQRRATTRQVMIRQEPNAVQMEPKTNLYQRMLLGRGQDLPLQVLVDGACDSGYHISGDSTSCASNDCSNEIDDGAGERTSHSGACQVTSCEAGFYEKTTGSCSEVEAVSGKYSPANDARAPQLVRIL